ncbi:MAG: Na-K-Cl cotransporter, partial [Candidatus Bipolaricaulia bacterium]
LGSIVPNTILMGDSQSPKHRNSYCKMIAQIHQAKRNVVIFRENPQRGFGKRRRIDIWWGESMQANGGLMLLLADLLRSDLRWREANIYIKLVVDHQSAVIPARDSLNRLLRQSRISAAPQIIVADGRSFDRILQETSRNADITFLGMATPDKHFPQHYEQLLRKVDGLPSTAFVLAAPNSSFLEMFQDFEEDNFET